MTIHRFAEQLEKDGSPSPLLEALRGLRAHNLDDLRSYSLEWNPWSDDQTPQAQVKKPELRC